MTGKKKVISPFQQELYEDTPWISRNRELNAQSYDLFKNALTDLGQQDQQYYEGLASRAMGSAYDDLNRNYQNAVNQNLARNYGRFGTTASTSGGYVSDSLQRQYNDMASRLATQQAQYQDQFINSALNRDLAKLQAYYTPFINSGRTTEAVDLMNYKIGQENRQRQWQADATKKMNKTGTWGKVGGAAGTVVGGIVGAYFGNPALGAQLGNALGSGVGGGFDNKYVMAGQQASQSDNGMLGGLDLTSIIGSKTNGKTASDFFGDVKNMFGKTKMSGGSANTWNIG